MINVVQLYPCSEVSTGSELYYLCEVGRYLKNYGEQLSLEGIILDKDLEKSKFWDYFCYSIENGCIAGVDLPTSSTSINLELLDMSKFFTVDLSKEETSPVFKLKNSDVWHWTLEGNNSSDEIHNINLLNGMTRSQSWVSLVAYVTVERMLNGSPRNLVLEFSNTVTHQKMAVADIYLLENETQALSGWVTLDYIDKDSCDYESWVYARKDKGLMSKPVHSDEKKEYFKKRGFRVGDAVFLYERGNASRTGVDNGKLRPIKDCKLAVIESVTKSGITFNTLGRANTRLGKLKEYENCCDVTKSLYRGKEFLKTNLTKVSFPWMDIGLDGLMFDEDFFFLDLNQADNVSLWVTNGVREDCIELSCPEASYWILKDGEVPFNEVNFKNRYTKGGVTLYDRYMSGEFNNQDSEVAYGDM